MQTITALLLLAAFAGHAAALELVHVCAWDASVTGSTADSPVCIGNDTSFCSDFPVGRCMAQTVEGYPGHGMVTKNADSSYNFAVAIGGCAPGLTKISNPLVEKTNLQVNQCSHVLITVPANFGVPPTPISVLIKDVREVEETTTALPCPACTESSFIPVCHPASQKTYANKECAKCFVSKWVKGACEGYSPDSNSSSTTAAPSPTTTTESCPAASSKSKCKNLCKKGEFPFTKSVFSTSKKGCKGVCECACAKPSKPAECDKACKKSKKTAVFHSGSSHESGCKNVCECVKPS